MKRGVSLKTEDLLYVNAETMNIFLLCWVVLWTPVTKLCAIYTAECTKQQLVIDEARNQERLEKQITVSHHSSAKQTLTHTGMQQTFTKQN